MTVQERSQLANMMDNPVSGEDPTQDMEGEVAKLIDRVQRRE
jgi:hypothetical protein